MLRPIVFTPNQVTITKEKCSCNIWKGIGRGDCKCGWDVGGGYPPVK